MCPVYTCFEFSAAHDILVLKKKVKLFLFALRFDMLKHCVQEIQQWNSMSHQPCPLDELSGWQDCLQGNRSKTPHNTQWSGTNRYSKKIGTQFFGFSQVDWKFWKDSDWTRIRFLLRAHSNHTGGGRGGGSAKRHRYCFAVWKTAFNVFGRKTFCHFTW